MKPSILLAAAALALLGLGSVSVRAGALPGDSLYHLDAAFTDQHGRAFKLADRRGRARIVAMFYTSCKFVCPLIVDSAKGVEHALNDDERAAVEFLLVTIDPARDDTTALLAVAERRRLDPARWTLARTGAAGVRQLAALLDVRYRALADGEFNHTSALYLLDGEGRVAASTATLGAVPDPAFVAAVRAALAAAPGPTSP